MRRRGLAALAWGAAVLALARIPAALGLIPALAVWRGPLGVALGLLALLVALAPLFEGRPLAAPSLRPWLLVLLAATALAGLGLHYASRLRVSGDEPHYLLMAQSLWREGDLDLRDNFGRGDYLEYIPALPAPHYGAPRRDGRPFPAHSPGLSLLLAPFYALGGRSACIVLLAMAAAWLALECRALALGAAAEPDGASWAWAAALGPPVAFYAFHIYTEVPSALALALALRLLLSSPGLLGAGLAAAAASALPWLHVKMIPAAAALGVVGVLRLSGRSRAVFLLVAAAGAALLAGYYWWIFGEPTPLALYGGSVSGLGERPPVLGLAGLLLDRSFGLLPYAPLFLLALAGLPRLFSGERWPHLLVGLAVLAPLPSWRMWWGGQCPPARFLVPLVPLLAVALALRLCGPARGLARWRWSLAAIGPTLMLFAVSRPEAMLLLNRRDRPTRLWDALSPEGGSVERYLPSLVSGEAAEVRVLLVWAAALALVLILDALARRDERVDRLFRGLGLPLVLLLIVGVLVDGWARA
jgi:hypothetical protein